MDQFPKAPDYTIRAGVSNFFENSRRYSQLKVHLIIPLGPFRIFSKIGGDICSSSCTTGVVDTGGKWKKSSTIKILFSGAWGKVIHDKT
jgi:hypothetical protein